MSRRYQAANPDDLILHKLDSMTLVFHRPSGITHIVSDPVPAILEVMAGKTMAAGDLAQRLSRDFDLEEGVDVENIVLARLDELSGLGLVEQVSD